jgi:predicted AAA+ superfamily ATPase
MLIPRKLTTELKRMATMFPVVAVLGPRQSGKTTLVREVFDHHTYISLEDYDIREQAINDPRLFLSKHPSPAGLILDEIQHTPQLLSYLQTIVDEQKIPGRFIITGSQNILVNEAVTQSLAGRIALLTLFPFSLQELRDANLLPADIETCLFQGSFARMYTEHVPADKWYPNYIQTYIERDVRSLKNVEHLHTFKKFMQLCAGRVGQLLNIESLAIDCSIDQKTARGWLSVLEATYVIFLLRPYHQNFGKRLIKAPKIYFFDTGIACSLLGIKQVADLTMHYMRGHLVESFVIADLMKQYYNINDRPALYFWRDQQGHEIDCLVEKSFNTIIPIEIKSGKTVTDDYFKGVKMWHQITNQDTRPYIVFAGDQGQPRTVAEVITWKDASTLIETLEQPART